MEPMLMIVAPGFFTMSGSKALVTRSTPSTLVCIMNSQSSSLPSATLSKPFAPPALLMRTSTLSVLLRTHLPNCSTELVWATSSARDSADVAPALTACAVTSLSRSRRLAPSKTLDPSTPKAHAAAAPKPLEAPVMTTHLSANREIILYWYQSEQNLHSGFLGSSCAEAEN